MSPFGGRRLHFHNPPRRTAKCNQREDGRSQIKKGTFNAMRNFGRKCTPKFLLKPHPALSQGEGSKCKTAGPHPPFSAGADREGFWSAIFQGNWHINYCLQKGLIFNIENNFWERVGCFYFRTTFKTKKTCQTSQKE